MPKKTRRAALATAPTLTRFAKASGSQPGVDREGGAYGAGLITGASVITTGEALGHYAWIDEVFLQQVIEAGNSFARGIKSRWTHPDMSSDGMGKLTSRLRKFSLAPGGTQVLANQHFLKIGHKSPDGDLASYLMELAEEDPEAYGLSIVFSMDRGEMDRFASQYKDQDGNFKSPDPANTNNYYHVRLAGLYAADAVDEPAANPNGLFSRTKDLAREASEVAAFALGLTSERPTVMQLGLDPERLRGFATRFLTSHNLEITPMKTKLNDASTAPTNDTPPAGEGTKPAEGGTTTEGEGTKPTEGGTSAADPEPAPVAAGAKNDAAKFKAAFGAKAIDYLAEGLTFEQAQAAFAGQRSDSLEERLAKLETQLKAGSQVSGEEKPVGFQAPGEGEKKKGFASKFRFSAVAKEVPGQK